MKLTYILALMVVCLISYSFCFGFWSRPKEDVVSDRLIKDIGQKLGQKYGMHLVGIGGGSKNGIWLFSMSFNRYGVPLDLEGARKLIIECTNVYLEEINKNEEIRPYLKVYPMKPENLNITIINLYPNGNVTPHPNISEVSDYRGTLVYNTYYSDDDPPVSEYEESYNDGLIKYNRAQIEANIH